jgi:hypothetical protein
MRWLNPCSTCSIHASASAGYPCDERKQIPLFSNTGAVCRFPWSGAERGSAHFQLNGGIQ